MLRESTGVYGKHRDAWQAQGCMASTGVYGKRGEPHLHQMILVRSLVHRPTHSQASQLQSVVWLPANAHSHHNDQRSRNV